MHSVSDTQAIISRWARILAVEEMPLAHARGRTLAVPVRLARDAPPFDRALVDGYALRAADAAAGAALRLIGQQAAGGDPAPPVQPQTCVGINTGAPMPAGADAVVMVERTRLLQMDGQQWVEVAAPVPAGQGFARRGSDWPGGDVALPAGTVLGPLQLAAAAAAGAATMQVYGRPRVAVLSTGDELVPLSATPGPGQIFNSNSTMLAALAAAADATAIDLGACRDDEGALRAVLEAALAQADLVVVAGGMSMGTRDLVPALWQRMGVQLLVQHVRMKPGKPFLFGVCGAPRNAEVPHSPAVDAGAAPRQRYCIGLPGNPVSAAVCFLRFVLPLLGLMQGRRPPPLPQAPCADALPTNGDREFYQPALLERSGGTGENRLRALPWKSSADVFTAAQATAFMMHPVHAPPRPAGTMLEYLPIPGAHGVGCLNDAAAAQVQPQ